MNNGKMHKIYNKHFENKSIYFHNSLIAFLNFLLLISYSDWQKIQTNRWHLSCKLTFAFHFGRGTKEKYFKNVICIHCNVIFSKVPLTFNVRSICRKGNQTCTTTNGPKILSCSTTGARKGVGRSNTHTHCPSHIYSSVV